MLLNAPPTEDAVVVVSVATFEDAVLIPRTAAFFAPVTGPVALCQMAFMTFAPFSLAIPPTIASAESMHFDV
ncbi:MAG: hypothetical protein LH632_14990 [Rhodoferax sp.]|nr:hypothetical protein [Rhodoferax sp.]